MFGNNNNQTNADDSGAPMPPDEPVADGTLAHDDAGTVVAPTNDDNNASPIGDPTPPPDTPMVGYNAPEPEESPAESTEAPAEPEENEQPPASDNAPAADNSSDDDLLGIKQQALQQLSPLVGHLDQTPEEKFRTTMMMIQASDDQSLVKSAYEAAQQIPDDKTRAQALLDVINEINYFTQPKNEN